MARDASLAEFVLDQLDGLEGLAARPMFGGHGLYAGAAFFGIVWKGSLWFLTSDRTRPAYLERGARAFAPRPKAGIRRYFEVPADVLEERRTLLAWARDAVAARAEVEAAAEGRRRPRGQARKGRRP